MIERSEDYRRIKKLTDEKLIVSREIFYLIDVDQGVDTGVLCFNPFNDGLSMHVQLGCKGKKAAQSCGDAILWTFENTACNIIYANIPVARRPVHFMARHVGFEFYGADEKFRLYGWKRNEFLQEAVQCHS